MVVAAARPPAWARRTAHNAACAAANAAAGLGPRATELVLTEGERRELALEAEDEWDAGDFLTLASSLSEEPPESRLQRALDAEARYTGTFLPEWRYEDWAEPCRERLTRAYREVLETVADELVGAGRAGAAIGRYEQLVELDPERERWHRRLMVLYAQTGERALALRQYHACRTVLRETLGVEPSRETEGLYRSLL